ncbi:hypothetical protein FRC12_002937 [Ceratobasidium sp. 428]|nr:hypothetical protein FRC12_002937 [Ceratobasidium sp. 428]
MTRRVSGNRGDKQLVASVDSGNVREAGRVRQTSGDRDAMSDLPNVLAMLSYGAGSEQAAHECVSDGGRPFAKGGQWWSEGVKIAKSR